MASKLPHRVSDLPKVDKDDLNEACAQFAEYVKFSELADSHTQSLSCEVENGLMRVDEFASLVDTIRGDRDKMLQKITPALIEKARDLQRVYLLVDQLGSFMRMMNKSVTQMEEQVNETAQAYSLVQRHRTINSFGLGNISSKYIPVKTASTMPDYPGIDVPNSAGFFEQWRKDAFDEELYKLPPVPTPVVPAP